MWSKEEGQNLCLLSLDGGGVRGLSSLYILKQLMERINPESPPKPCEIFDLIGGTSTGGLIAIMLGRLRMDIDTCIDAYVKMSDKIFQKVAHRATLSGKVQARFDSEGLTRAIKDIIKNQGLPEDEVFMEKPAQGCRVFVCATRGESRTLTRLSSYFAERSANDDKIMIWEACRATSAASTFFDPIKIGKHGETYLDGATGANNPIRQLWSAAKDIWNEGRLDDRINCIVSIGTGRPSITPFGSSIEDVAKTLLATATETEETAESFARENTDLTRSKKYFRLNVDRGLEGIGLERSDKASMIVAATRTYLESQAAYESVIDVKNKLSTKHELLNESARHCIPFEEDPDFVGRNSETSQVEKCFRGNGRIALVGIGGVGKSQIAINYLHHLKREFPETWIFWVFSGTRGRFVQAYRKIAEQLKLPQRNDPDVNILQLVADWLNQPNHNSTWIMVLDNADDVNMFIDTNTDQSSTLGLLKASDDPLIMYLPDAERGKVLITTRDTGAALNFTGSGDKIVHVGPMSMADAKYLVYKKLDTDHRSDPDIEKLVGLLGAIPLALTQAASYINSGGRRRTIDNYISLFTTTQLSSLRLLEHEIQDDRRDASQSGSIITTWQVSFDHVRQRNPGACELLCFMTMLDIQAVPEFLLALLVPDKLDLEDDLSMLMRFSFVRQGESECIFKIHLLVELAVRRWLESRNEFNIWNSKALNILSTSFPPRNNILWGGKNVWERRNKLWPHVQRVLQYFSIEREDLLCRATILLRITEDALDRECFQQRGPEAAEALELRQQILGDSHILTAEGYAILGRVRLFEGNFEESRHLLERAQCIALESGGSTEDLLTGDIALFLADLLVRLDQTKEAETLIIETMNARKRAFGEVHAATVRSMTQLGLFYQITLRYGDAESMLASSINASQKLFGRSHPSTLFATLYLAIIHLNAANPRPLELQLEAVDTILETQNGIDVHIKIMSSACRLMLQLMTYNVSKTLELLQTVFENVTKEFGIDSIVISDFTRIAGLVWTTLDRLDDARDLARRLYSNVREKLGYNHPVTVEAMIRLANILALSKETLQAEELAKQALSLCRARQGIEHPVTLQVEMLVSEVLVKTGSHESAVQLATHVYNIRQERFGQDHFRTAEALNRLAEAHLGREDFVTARKEFIQVFETYKRLYGLDHYITISTIGLVICSSVPQSSAALVAPCESYADVAVKFWETRLGPDHRKTLVAEHNRFHVKLGLKKWGEGAKLGVSLLHRQQQIVGQNAKETLKTMSGLAICYSYLKRYKEEEDLTRFVLQETEKAFGLENSETIRQKVELSNVLSRTNQIQELEEVQQSIYLLKRKMMGDYHVDTIKALEKLKATRQQLTR